MTFDSKIEVIYGHSNGFHDDSITIDVFLIKSKNNLDLIYLKPVFVYI